MELSPTKHLKHSNESLTKKKKNLTKIDLKLSLVTWTEKVGE